MEPGDRTFACESPADAVAFLEGGKTVAALCRDGTLRRWDAASGRPAGSQTGIGRGGGFLRRADAVASLSDDGSIVLWDAGKAARTRTFATEGRPQRFVVADDASHAAAAYMHDRQTGVNTIRVYGASGREALSTTAGIGGISVLAFSPDGSKLLAASNDADMRVWNVRNGELVRLIDELAVTMFAAAFSPDGRLLATAGADRTLYLWDTATWKMARRLTGQPEMISALEFSADGRRVVTGGFSERTAQHPVSLVVWDVQTGKQIRSMPVPRRVSAVAFSPTGRQIASAYGIPSVNVWQVPE
jgi:WD40 repeat protein